MLFLSSDDYSMPLEWIEYISDWRWISPNNDIFRANCNWYDKLPKKIFDAIIAKEGVHEESIQNYMTCYLLGEGDPRLIRYKATALFPMDIEQVLKVHIHKRKVVLNLIY